MEDLGTSEPVRPASAGRPAGHGANHPTTRRARFRPSRWGWTTLASDIVLIALTIPIASAATAVGGSTEASFARPRVGVSEVVGRGWLLAVLPCAIVIFTAWRIRRRGEEEELRSAAMLGVAAVTVPCLGLLIGLLQVPHDPEPRLVLLTATFVVGLVLLGCSMWLRHVPRP